MAKFTSSFKAKGLLNLAEGIVYETKNEVTRAIPFFEYLREFDEKVVSISITEDVEINGEVNQEAEDE